MNQTDLHEIDVTSCPWVLMSCSAPGKCRTMLEALEHPCPLRQAVVWMLGLLEELEELHRLGSLHLDICPNNILLAKNGVSETVILSRCRILNTPTPCCRSGYAAPEVVNGNADSWDYSTDLYSVTAVFFHCIMGRKLTLREALLPKAPDGKDSPMLADVPPAARTIVRRILRKGLNVLPDRRYRSIGPMRRALKDLLNTLPQIVKEQIP